MLSAITTILVLQ